MQRDVKSERECLKDHEHDNYPCGAVRTDHRFCTHRKFRSNEEMFPLSDEEILPGNIITRHIESLLAMCCRGVFHHTKEGLANIFRVHGEGIALFSGTAQDGTVLTKTGTPPGTPDMPFRTDGTDGITYATIETGDFNNANAGNATFECGVLLAGNEYTVVTGILFIKPTML